MHYYFKYFSGFALNELGRKEASFAYFSKSLVMDPFNYIGCYNRGRDDDPYFLGVLLTQMGKNQEAKVDYSKVIQINYAESYNNRGSFYFIFLGCELIQLGNIKEALVDFSKALKSNTYYDDAYNNRSRLNSTY